MPRINSQNRSAGDEISATRQQDFNQDIDDLYSAGNDRFKAYRALSGTALKIDIGPGNFLVGTVHGYYAGATDISVTNSATNYIMIDSSGTIQQSTSAWNVNYARIAEVVCSGGVITSITDRRNDVLGGSLFSFDINGQTEKTIPVNADEMLLGDSEDANANKKITISNLYRKFSPFKIQSSTTIRYSDNPDWFVVNNGSNSLILNNNAGICPYRNGNQQSISWATIGSGSGGNGDIIYNGRIYTCGNTGGNTKIYSCSVTDDISVAGNRSNDFTINSVTYNLIGWDGTGLCFIGNTSSKLVYRYSITGTHLTDLTFSSLPANIQVGSIAYNGKYILASQGSQLWYYARNASDNDISGLNGGIIVTSQARFMARCNTLMSADTNYTYYKFTLSSSL